MTKSTKKQKEKQNTELKIKITELELTIEQLKKDKMSLQVKLDFYEGLPKAATDMVGGSIDFILKSAFPPQQAQK